MTLNELYKASRSIAGKGRYYTAEPLISYTPIGEGIVVRRDLTAALKILRKRPGLRCRVVPAEYIEFTWDGGRLRLLIHQPGTLMLWNSAAA